MAMLLEMRNISKSFPGVKALNGFSIDLKAGEVHALVGENGAGKSTTIRTLLGLIAPTTGSAMIFGKDVTKEKESILQDIGYLPSEAVFYQGMKVKDILKLSADLRKKDCTAEAKMLCERLQLDTARKVDDLSFGNRKKVAIVCALQHNPDLLVLDEPTGGLDPLMQKEFFDILRERNKEGATIFLSSHVLSEIQKSCTRAAIIRDGRIIACDSVDALSKTSAKRVIIHGTVDLTHLNGICDKKEVKDSISFLYSGDMGSLLRVLSSGHVDDLTVTEPDLEEIFLHYYEKDGETV